MINHYSVRSSFLCIARKYVFTETKIFLLSIHRQIVTMQILICLSKKDLHNIIFIYIKVSADTRTLANMISFNSTKLMCKSYNVIIVINKLPQYCQ